MGLAEWTPEGRTLLSPIQFILSAAQKRGGLLDHADLSAAILRPGGFVGTRIGRHLGAEADRLDVLGRGPQCDEGFADGAGATFAEAAVVLSSSAFIGETGNNNLAAALLQKAGDLLDFSVLGAADGLAVEVEINRLELIAIDVAAHERSAILAIGQRRSSDVIARAASGLAAALLFRATDKNSEEEDESEKAGQPNDGEKRTEFLIHSGRSAA